MRAERAERERRKMAELDAVASFEGLMAEYPNPGAKAKYPDAVRRAYEAVAIDQKTKRQIASALRWWKQSHDWTKEGGQYINQATEWLSRGLWRQAPIVDEADAMAERIRKYII
jgi:DNA replication protein DnaC